MQRLLEQRIVVEVDLADGEVVGRAPVGVDQRLFLAREPVLQGRLLFPAYHKLGMTARVRQRLGSRPPILEGCHSTLLYLIGLPASRSIPSGYAPTTASTLPASRRGSWTGTVKSCAGAHDGELLHMMNAFELVEESLAF